MRKFIALMRAFFNFQPWHAIASLGLMLISSVLQGASLLLLIPLVNFTLSSDNDGAALPGFISHILPQSMTLVTALLLYMSIVATTAVVTYLNSLFTSKLQLQFTSFYRKKLLDGFYHLPWQAMISYKKSDIAATMNNSVNNLSFAANMLIRSISGLILMGIYLGSAFLVSTPLTSVALLCGASIFYFLRRQQQTAHSLGQKFHQKTHHMLNDISQHFDSIKTAKAYGMVDAYQQQFDQTDNELITHKHKFAKLSAYNKLLYTVCGAVGFSGIFYFSNVYLQMPLSTLFVLLVIFARLMPQLSSFQTNLQHVANALPAYEHIQQCLTEFADLKEPSPGNLESLSLSKSIALNHIRYQYPNADTAVINDISAVIPAHQITAITGHSGIGKTTLLDIIIGLLSPDSGQVLVDGVVLSQNNLASWQKSMSYVTQETHLFHDTLRNNLTWTNHDLSDDDIWQALELAQAHTFVKALPDQLDTIVGDGGMMLSGGERQRIALARALLRKPQLLILDEATNALDYDNENLIFEVIAKLKGKVTTIIITHRLDTVDRMADCVIRMENVHDCSPVAL